MRDKRVEDFDHKVKLCLIDRFDHEPLVMGQKEETSTFARAFTCLENLIVVQVR